MNMRKQRCMGVALLVVSAVIWLLASTGETVEERDGTALLLTFPLGIYLLVSKTYDWADVDFKFPGLDIEVQEISYDDELDQEAVYGKGNKPRGFGTGNYSGSGKISLLRDDYHKMLAYCKAKGVSFFKLQFPSVVVSYGMEGEKTVVDELKLVQISKRSNSVTQGDRSVKVSLDLAIYGGIVQDGVEPI